MLDFQVAAICEFFVDSSPRQDYDVMFRAEIVGRGILANADWVCVDWPNRSSRGRKSHEGT